MPHLRIPRLYFAHSMAILNASDKVLDLSEKLKIKQEEAERNRLTKELQTSAPILDEQEPTKDQLSQKREQKFLAEIQNASGVWMHRFSDVRKDDIGYYILKSDNPAGSKMRVGDQLADQAINMTPYWRVASIDNNRINLEPLPKNPLASGIGAGGARIDKHDIDVYTGKYEQDQVAKINQALESGKVSIDLIKYILPGTVPVNFGPNGSQGGWYNVDDTYSNRGGRQNLDARQIMMADAQTIRDHGVPVPLKALDGSMEPRTWSDWVGGNGSSNTYVPRNVDKYVDFTRQMVDRGKWRHDADTIAEQARRYDPVRLEQYYDQMLQDVSSLSPEEWKLKYRYYDQDTASVLRYYESAQRGQEKAQQASELYLTEGETNDIDSIMRNVFSRERRIVNRNVLQLIELSKEEPSYVKYLHDIMNLGGASDWFANEEIINYFNLIDDVDGLKLAATKLKDSTNLRYALSALYEQGQSDFALEQFTKHLDDMEVLDSMMSRLYSEYDKSEIRKSTFGRNDKLLNVVRAHDLVSKMENAVAGGDVINKHHVQEAASLILRSFGPVDMWQAGDQELVSRLKALR